MQPKALTEFGVKKIINEKGYADPIFQLIEFADEKKQVGNDSLYCCFISDGNAKLKCYFCDQLQTKIVANKHKLNNQIIKLKTYGATSKSVLIYEYDVLIDDYKETIGSPILYKDFLASGDSVPKNQINQSMINKPLLSSKKAVAEVPGNLKNKIELGDSSDYDLIAHLYPDFQNWKLYARITKLNYSEFESRAGKHIKLLNLQLTDKVGSSINANIFGECAEKLSQTLSNGETYTFSKGLVKIDTYKKNNGGNSQYNILFTEHSKIQPTTDDKTIKSTTGALCLLSDIKNKPPGTNVDLIGIVKEVRNPTENPSKDRSKTLKKQTVVICDPIEKVQIDIIFWNDLAKVEKSMESKTVLFSDFRVHEFNGSVNINSNIKSRMELVDSHPFKQYEKNVASLEFNTVSYRRDESNMKIIRNVAEMNADVANMTEKDSVWADLRVFLNRVKDRAKRTYDSCPYCKKAVQPDDTTCSNGTCNKSFDRPKARYILNIELSDYSGSFWTTAYDEFAEKIFKVAGDYPANEVKNFNQKQFEQLTKKCLFQEFKMKVVTKYENSTDGQKRTKHNIAKWFPLDPLTEARSNLEYIKKRLA